MFSALYKLKWFFKMYQRRYIIGSLLLVLSGLLELLPPRMVGQAIDQIQQGVFNLSILVNFLIIFFVLMISIYVISYIWSYQIFGSSFLIELILRKRFMKHLLKMTPTFFEKNQTGDLMARATNDLNAVSATVGFGVMTLYDSSINMLAILFMMGVVISWKLTLAAIIPLPLIALAMSIYGKKIHERFTIAQNAFGDLNDHVLESISGVRVLRAYVQEKADEIKFQKLTNEVLRKNIDVARMDAMFESTIKFLIGISYIIGLSYGAYLVFKQEITLGELVSFNVYLGILIWPMFAIGELINVMQRGSASMDRVNEILQYPPDVQDDEATSDTGSPGEIVFDQVTFVYPSSETENLKDVSFTLPYGQTLGVVGKTGSGKTTLLKQLLRQYPLGQGTIKIGEKNLQNIALGELSKWMGYVPQEPILFSRTIRENILYGKHNGTEIDVQRALESANFVKDIEMLPEGLNTIVGERGVSLSGGQKQRVSIARALIADPEILLLDDALSAVDAKTEAKIIANIKRDRVGRTTLITTHRLSAVQHADIIVVLENGQIIERGTHKELLALKGWYRKQFESQKIEENLL